MLCEFHHRMVLYISSNQLLSNCYPFRECSFEKCWGGGGHPNSVLDLGGGGRVACEFCVRGKEPATLHFQIIINLNKRC